MSKKASFKKSFIQLVLAIALFMGFRWALYEPYVIPSGSMIPTLLIHDHIVVNKFAYGIRIPFTKSWLTPIKAPTRGDIVVFRSVESDDFFMIKRVVGLPGDHITINAQGEFLVDGTPLFLRQVEVPNTLSEEDLEGSVAQYTMYEETLGSVRHAIMLEAARSDAREGFDIVVPPGHLFMTGDNRDRSRDSRYWGTLPLENLLGRAEFIWLSCEKTLAEQSPICNPRTIRWRRLFQAIQ